MKECIYRGNELGEQIFECSLLTKCSLSEGGPFIPSCDQCKQRLEKSDSGFSSKWIDPLRVTNSRTEPTEALRSSLVGATGFLLGGGPSVNDLDLSLMAQRGIWTMAINNAGAHPRIRPHAFVCSDPPRKFHHSIWLDPGIMKWIPSPKFHGGRNRNQLRRKMPDGSFEIMDRNTRTAPNVWGFERRSWMVPDDTFFTEHSAAWGNQDIGMRLYGERKTACTMLIGIRLMYYLGIRRIFLLGCDFRMRSDYGYSFGQGRTQGAINSNNEHFEIANDWFCRLTSGGVFNQFGLELYNCYEYSGIRAFPYVPYKQAVEIACEGIDQYPDCSCWYEDEIEIEGVRYSLIEDYGVTVQEYPVRPDDVENRKRKKTGKNRFQLVMAKGKGIERLACRPYHGGWRWLLPEDVWITEFQ